MSRCLMSSKTFYRVWYWCDTTHETRGVLQSMRSRSAQFVRWASDLAIEAEAVLQEPLHDVVPYQKWYRVENVVWPLPRLQNLDGRHRGVLYPGQFRVSGRACPPWYKLLKVGVRLLLFMIRTLLRFRWKKYCSTLQVPYLNPGKSFPAEYYCAYFISHLAFSIDLVSCFCLQVRMFTACGNMEVIGAMVSVFLLWGTFDAFQFVFEMYIRSCNGASVSSAITCQGVGTFRRALTAS